jgi:hypothetical protein
MSEDLLRRIAEELNNAPDAARRAAQAAPLVAGVNARVAAAAERQLTLDTTPYAYAAWLVEMDKR